MRRATLPLPRRVNAELEASRAADKASGAAVQLKGLEAQAEGARREAAELRESRLEAEAAHNKERLQQAGLLVRRAGGRGGGGALPRSLGRWLPAAPAPALAWLGP